jgi:hypothetical protein
LQANALTNENKEILAQFLGGNRTNPNPELGPIRQILLNEDHKIHPSGVPYVEQIIFEINYQTGTWKKLRRKKVIGDGAAVAVATPVPALTAPVLVPAAAPAPTPPVPAPTAVPVPAVPPPPPPPPAPNASGPGPS